MGWKEWLGLGAVIYLIGYVSITVYKRAQDINVNRKSYNSTYTMGLAWPLAVLLIPVWLVEATAQLIAKYMSYKDSKVRLEKLNKVS